MKALLLASLCLGALTLPAAVQAQGPVVQTINGTRLDLSVTGEVSRVPDIANISAGVVTRAASATAAISQNAVRMERVRAALKRAGIEDRDIQTNSINLNPEYRYQDNHAPVLTGYTASNQVSIRFRDIRNIGKILDALVAEGDNQINGPNLSIDNVVHGARGPEHWFQHLTFREQDDQARLVSVDASEGQNTEVAANLDAMLEAPNRRHSTPVDRCVEPGATGYLFKRK